VTVQQSTTDVTCREATVTTPASPCRWTDVEGNPLVLLCRVEQIRVDSQGGAMPARLRQQGQVVGWDTLVLTSPDTDSETTLAPELSQAGVRLHGAGGWVALAATSTGLVLFQRWWTRPAEGQTRLRPADQVQRGLLAALPNSRFDGFDIRRGDGDDEKWRQRRPSAPGPVPVVPRGRRGRR
jgi:hypothetical protein